MDTDCTVILRGGSLRMKAWIFIGASFSLAHTHQKKQAKRGPPWRTIVPLSPWCCFCLCCVLLSPPSLSNGITFCAELAAVVITTDQQTTLLGSWRRRRRLAISNRFLVGTPLETAYSLGCTTVPTTSNGLDPVSTKHRQLCWAVRLHLSSLLPGSSYSISLAQVSSLCYHRHHERAS